MFPGCLPQWPSCASCVVTSFTEPSKTPPAALRWTVRQLEAWQESFHATSLCICSVTHDDSKGASSTVQTSGAPLGQCHPRAPRQGSPLRSDGVAPGRQCEHVVSDTVHVNGTCASCELLVHVICMFMNSQMRCRPQVAPPVGGWRGLIT